MVDGVWCFCIIYCYVEGIGSGIIRGIGSSGGNSSSFYIKSSIWSWSIFKGDVWVIIRNVGVGDVDYCVILFGVVIYGDVCWVGNDGVFGIVVVSC